MTQTVISITSNDDLDDIESHFRVSAGPGAGKTHWLAQHTKRVVRDSERLTPCARVLCLSYTNIAVSELVSKLGSCAERVEVSTIHAFLYKYVLKPYAHLLKDSSGRPLVNHAAIDGHEEHRPARDKIEKWLKSINSHRATINRLLNIEYSVTREALSNTRWWPQDDGSWQLGFAAGCRRPEFFPSSQLGTYKSFYWEDGIVDHEDVIYLSRLILIQNPELIRFISARFPYIFVDEFQDTQPAQTEMLLKFANVGSVVGVIGDVQQSIYGFINARPADFYSIDLPHITDYSISHNRRSSGEIVRFLNAVRKDALRQESVNGDNGISVKVLHGELKDMVDYVQSQNTHSPPVFLARTNKHVAELRRISKGQSSREVWDELEHIDFLRARFLRRLLQATEFVRKNQMGFGVKRAIEALSFHHSQMGKLFTPKGSISKLRCQGIAMSLLKCDIHLNDTFSLLEAYNAYSAVLDSHSVRIKAIKTGNPLRFAQEITLGQLRIALDTPDAKTEFRTIHSAKGAEFDTVGLFLFEKENLEKCLNPQFNKNERVRLSYVAMSRAKSSLIVCLEEAPDTNLSANLLALGAEIIGV